MSRLRFALPLIALLLLGITWAQEKPDDKTPKARGILPANFKKLGLTDAQKDKIYALQAQFRGKQDDLKRQIDKLKADEKDAVEKILSAEQLKRLKELRAGEPAPKEKDTTKGKDAPKEKDKDTPKEKDKDKA